MKKLKLKKLTNVELLKVKGGDESDGTNQGMDDGITPQVSQPRTFIRK
jgi:hypothetical protein